MPATTTISIENIPTNARCSPANVVARASAPSGATTAAKPVKLTMVAVPKLAPTWLVVLPSGVECWIILLSSEFTPQVFKGVTRNWMPISIIVKTKHTSKKLVSMPYVVRKKPAIPSTAAPGTTSLRTPNLSNNRPASRPHTAPMTAPGSMMRPDVVALHPSTCCT